MANEGLLSLIAQPRVVDPAEQFRVGRREKLSEDVLRTNLGTAQRQEQTTVDKIALGNTFSFAGSASLLGENLEKQNELIKLMVVEAQKAGIPQGVAIAQELLQTPPQDRPAMFNEIKQIGVESGYIKPQTFAKDTRTQIQKNVTAAGFVPDTPEFHEEMRRQLKGKSEVGKVGAQQILEDGTVIQSTPSGTKVYNPQGQLVKGQQAADTIKIARAIEISNARKKSGEKKLAVLEAEDELKAKVAAKVIGAEKAAVISVNAFERLQQVRTGINNMNEAISLIDQGAQTGAIVSKLPSIRAASVKLDNLQGRLGLDVIGNTTFGALSESELRFALDTALPKKLQGAELRSWLVEKRDAQEKLADYIEAASIYLGTPGNTVAGWVERQRGKATPTQTDSAVDLKTLSDAELLKLAEDL